MSRDLTAGNEFPMLKRTSDEAVLWRLKLVYDWSRLVAGSEPVDIDNVRSRLYLAIARILSPTDFEPDGSKPEDRSKLMTYNSLPKWLVVLCLQRSVRHVYITVPRATGYRGALALTVTRRSLTAFRLRTIQVVTRISANSRRIPSWIVDQPGTTPFAATGV
jgi:hypothetical protein